VKRTASWVGIALAVVLATAIALLPPATSQFLRRVRERIGWVPAKEIEYETDLLADAFKKGSGAEEPYQPARRGELQFNKQIAAIVYQKCARCHYAGGVAPFPLTSLAEVRKRARRIKQVVGRRVMPPWLPDRCSPEFSGDSSLSNREKGMLEQWLAEGCREGDPRNAPPPPAPPPEWPYGPPDAVVQPAEAYKVPAEGPDEYRWFVIPTNYSDDRFVRLADIAPGSKAVHHALIYADSSGGARALDEAEPGPGFATFGFPAFTPSSQFGQWEPGVGQHTLPDGIGYFLPRGADIVIQVHYHPTGKEETDLSRVALYFCNKPVEKQLRCLPIVVPPPVLKIRAGESNVVFWAELEMPGDITVHQIFPHMHLLAHETAAAAFLPDGALAPIIRISNWDFRWQNVYALKTPLRLPKGTRVRLEGRFDNSAANPRNPNQPPKPVRFGLRTTDEMCMVSLLYTVDSENLIEGRRAGPNYPDTFFPQWWRRIAGGRK